MPIRVSLLQLIRILFQGYSSAFEDDELATLATSWSVDELLIAAADQENGASGVQMLPLHEEEGKILVSEFLKVQ